MSAKKPAFRKVVERKVDLIWKGWANKEIHSHAEWIMVSGLAPGVVSVQELTRTLGAGPTTAPEFAHALCEIYDLDDDRKKLAASRAAKAKKAAEEAHKAEQARRAAEEARKAEQARRAAEEARKAEQARKAAEEARKAEQARRAAEEARKAEQARKAAEEARKAEQARRAAEEARKAEQARRAAEEARKAEQARKAAEEARKAEQARKAAEEARKAEQARRAAEEARKAEQARRAAEEARKAEQARRAAEEARKAEQARRAAEEARKAEQARRAAEEARKAEQARKAALRKDFGFGVALLAIVITGAWFVSRGDGNGRTDETDLDDTRVAERLEGDRSPPQISSLRLIPSRAIRNADSLTWRITFSETVIDVDADDFVIIGLESEEPVTVTKVRATGDVYDITLRSDDLADYNGRVALGMAPQVTITDQAGNRLLSPYPTGRYESSFVIDNDAPIISSLVRQTPPVFVTNADSVTWRITFTEAVTAVDADDFVIIGLESEEPVTVTKVRATGDVYDITLHSDDLADHNDIVALAVKPRATIADLADNSLFSPYPTGRYESSFVIDNDSPSVTIGPEGGRIDEANADLTLAFTEPVYGDAVRTVFTGSTLAGLLDLREDDEDGVAIPFTASIDPHNRTATISPRGALPATTWVRVKNTYYDVAGNRGRAAAEVFRLDTTELAIPQRDAARNDNDPLSVTIDPEGGEPAPPSMTQPATEVGRRPNVDRSPPRIRSLVRRIPSVIRTNADSLTWRITFSEAMGDIDNSDFAFSGIDSGRLTVAKVRASGDVYDITLHGDDLADLNGGVALRIDPEAIIVDRADNRLASVYPTGRYEPFFIIDNDSPSVTIGPEGGIINAANANLTLTFTEAVYGDTGQRFTESTLAGLLELRQDNEGGAATPFTASIDAGNETVTIYPNGTLPATTWVRVKNTYLDAAGNRGEEVTAMFLLDAVEPTATIDEVPATDRNGFMATVTFSEPVRDFTVSDIAVTNGTASALTEVQPGRQWAVRITPSGDYEVSLPADRVTDLAGNRNTASISRSGSYGADITDPRLVSVVRVRTPSSPAPADSITWRVTFSEDVEHFNTSSIALLDQSDDVLAVIPAVSGVTDSESIYDVTFKGDVLASYHGVMKLRFRTISHDGRWYSVNVQDKSRRLLPCCSVLGSDERTVVIDIITE